MISYLGLQQFRVIPFEIRTLKKSHTEKWRTRRIVYNKAISNMYTTPLSLFVPSAPP